MFDNYSVKAVISAEKSSSFDSTFRSATSIVSNLTGGVKTGISRLTSITSVFKSGLGMGIAQGIGQKLFSTLESGIKTVASSTGDAVKRFDTLNNYPNVMSRIKGATGDANQSIQKLSTGIQGLPTALDDIVASTQQFAVMNKDIDKSTNLSLALNDALLMSGSTAEQAQRGMDAYTKAVAKGKFESEEYKTLQETMSVALDQVAESFGYTGPKAQQEFYDALKSGKISVDEFNEKMIELDGRLEDGSAGMEGFASTAYAATDGIGTAMTNLRLSVTIGLQKMLSGIDKTWSETGGNIAQSLNSLKGVVSGFFNSFMKNGKDASDGVRDEFVPLIQGIRDLFEDMVNNRLPKLASGVVDVLARIASSPVMGQIKDALYKAFDWMEVYIPKIVDTVLPILGKIVSAAIKVADGVASAIGKIVDSPEFKRLADDIGKVIEWIGTTIPKVINAALPYIKVLAEFAMEVGEAFGEAIAAITDSATSMDNVKSGADLLRAALTPLKAILKGVAGFLKDNAWWIGKVINVLPTLIATVYMAKGAFSVFNGVMGVVKSVLGDNGILGTIGKVISKFTSLKNIVSGGNVFSTLGSKLKESKGEFTTLGSIIQGFASKFSNVGNTVKAGTGTFTSFASVAKSALSNVGTYASNAGSSVYQMSGNFTSLAGVAESQVYNITSNLSDVSSTASTVGSKVTSSIGGGFQSAASTATSNIGGIMSSIGGLVAGIGAAVGVVFTLVTAIMKWKEEQYKAGQAMHEMTEEEKRFIEKCEETCKAYENIQTAARNSYAERESEIQYTELLLGKYDELLDENGKVIEGKEKLAETLMGQVCESLGMEKGEIESLRGEYQNLIDDNGKVKQGYEERADEILTTLAQAWGLEKSEIAEIIGNNKDLRSTIEDVTNAKRENAKVEAITEAEKQATKDQIQLQSEQRQLTQLQKEAQQEYDAFLAEHGDHLNKLTDEQRGEYDKLRENLSKYDTSLHENQIALQETENVHRICGDALVANAEGNTDVMEQCWWRLTEGIKDHTNGSREELKQQVLDAQEYLKQKKEAYEKNANDTTKAEMDEAEKRLEYVSSSYDNLLNNQDGYLTKSLQSQKDAAQKELDEAQAKLDELNRRNSRYNENRFKEDDTAAKELVAQKKKALDDIERDLEASLITQESLGNKHNSTTERNLNTSLQNQKGIYSNFHTQIDGQVRNHSNNVVSAAKTATDNVNSTLDRRLNDAVSVIGSKQGSFSQSASRVAGGVTSGFSVISNMTQYASNQMQNAINAIVAKQNTAHNRAGDVARAVMTGLRNIMNSNITYAMGGNVVNGLINGLNARRSNVMNTAYSIASAVTSTIAGALKIGSPSKITTEFGEWTSIGFANGIASKIKNVQEASANVANASVEGITNALQIHSPSRVMAFLGEYAIDGYVKGVTSSVAKAEKATTIVATKAVTALAKIKMPENATSGIASQLISNINNSTTQQIQKLQKELDWYVSSQKQALQNYTYAQVKARDHYAANQVKATDAIGESLERKTAADERKINTNKKAIESAQKKVSDYNKQLQNLQYKYNHANDVKSNKRTRQLEADIKNLQWTYDHTSSTKQNKAYKQSLKDRINSLKDSLKQEKNLITKSNNRTKENLKNQINNLKKKISSENSAIKSYKTANTKLNNEIDKLWKQHESAYEKLHSNLKKKTDDTNSNISKKTEEVNKNIASKYEETMSQISKLDEELLNSYVSSAKTRAERLKLFNRLNTSDEVTYWQTITRACKTGSDAYYDAYTQFKSARDALVSESVNATKSYVSEITKVQSELETAIASRKSALTGTGLFDEMKFNDKVEKSGLIKYMQDQVTALEIYDQVMNSLKKKLGNSDLYKELQAMDISQLATLQSVDKMTKAELKQYQELYKKRDELAEQRAEKENAALIASSEKQINSLTTSYEKALTQMGLTVESSSEVVGQAIISGINTGLSESKSGLDAALQKYAQSMIKTVKDELGIHSPSKEMEYIGNMMSKGLVNSLQGNMGTIEKVATQIAENTTKALDNIIVFPTMGDIQREIQSVNGAVDINSKTLENINQTIVVQANLDVDGRTFSQTIAPNTSRAISENKRRRRA